MGRIRARVSGPSLSPPALAWCLECFPQGEGGWDSLCRCSEGHRGACGAPIAPSSRTRERGGLRLGDFHSSTGGTAKHLQTASPACTRGLLPPDTLCAHPEPLSQPLGQQAGGALPSPAPEPPPWVQEVPSGRCAGGASSWSRLGIARAGESLCLPYKWPKAAKERGQPSSFDSFIASVI